MSRVSAATRLIVLCSMCLVESPTDTNTPTMNVNLESPSALRRKLTIELEPAEIKTELDRTYNDLRRNVVLKGFRPGHAPRTMLERLFGDRVRGEIVQKLIKEYTDKALEEQNLKPLLPPEIVTEESDLAKSLRFSVPLPMSSHKCDAFEPLPPLPITKMNRPL